MESNRLKKTGQKKKFKKVIKIVLVWFISALISGSLTKEIFDISGLNYPYPIWLAYFMLVGFLILLPPKISSIFNQFQKVNNNKNKVVLNYEDFK
jgi:hypothetical protein